MEYPEADAAIREWETKTFFQSVNPAKLATGVQELIQALNAAAKRVDNLKMELAILRRQAGLSARHQDERHLMKRQLQIGGLNSRNGSIQNALCILMKRTLLYRQSYFNQNVFLTLGCIYGRQ